MVRLQTTSNVDLFAIKTAQDCTGAAANPEIVSELEELVTVWCKQIEQVEILVVVMINLYAK